MDILPTVKDLDLPYGLYAVFGSGPLAVRGLREANDIDLIVKQDLWKELIRTYTPFRGQDVSDEKIILQEGIDVFHTWPGFSNIEQLIDTADYFNGIPFVQLQHVLTYKQQSLREKDKKDVLLIQEYYRRI